jgi:hypothetical protein
VVGAATTTTMTTVCTVSPLTTDCGATAVVDGREDLVTATSKRRQWGQCTANNDCHGKRQVWVGEDDKCNQQEQADDDGE